MPAPTSSDACSRQCSRRPRRATATRCDSVRRQGDEPRVTRPAGVRGRLTSSVAALALACLAGAPVAAQSSRPCTTSASAPVARLGAWPAPLDAPVTLRARGISLRDALDRIGANSGVPLAYSSDLLPLDRPVCVVAERQPLGQVLATLLVGTNVEALVVARKVVLAPTASPRDRKSTRLYSSHLV